MCTCTQMCCLTTKSWYKLLNTEHNGLNAWCSCQGKFFWGCYMHWHMPEHPFVQVSLWTCLFGRICVLLIFINRYAYLWYITIWLYSEMPWPYNCSLILIEVLSKINIQMMYFCSCLCCYIFINSFSGCVCVWHIYDTVHMEVRGPPAGVSSLLLPQKSSGIVACVLPQWSVLLILIGDIFLNL